MADQAQLRALPSVNEVLENLPPSLARFPHALLVAEARRALDAMRAELIAGKPPGPTPEVRIERAINALAQPTLRRVINATGVVLHTNLGRAPLAAFTPPPGYSNLEYDLATGRRGKRDVHASALLERLLDAPAIAVNNNAAAIFLALNELASGGEVIVSRGELIEIGDGFRIPDIMARSGATLCEVGATNRTHIDDYRAAVTPRTRLLLRVHPSNFSMSGFTARVALPELAALGREHNIPVYEDLGSGCVADLRAFGIDEPLVSASLKAGANLVSFSGDKLLGGPQAGILAGDSALVTRLRRNPLFRALRLDKLIYQALGETLRHLVLEEWDAIPALAMIRQTPAAIRARSEALIRRTPGLKAETVEGHSVIGGGATPEQPIPTWLIALSPPDAAKLEQRLRESTPPVIARIEDGKVLLDLRTVQKEEEEDLAHAIRAASSVDPRREK